ncbi:MAG: N-acetylmuramoyl-L-alanine amidase [Bacilli bacterium]
MKNKIGIILIVIISLLLLFKNIKKYEILNIDEIKVYQLQKNDSASLNKYYIYGTHLNFFGNLKSNEKPLKVELILKGKDNTLNYKLEFTYIDNIVNFKTSNMLNEGINLENINIDNYLLYIKVCNKNIENYYSIKNKTFYNNLTYYKVSNNEKTEKINIEFLNNYRILDIENDYLIMNVENIELPKDVYDIVLDPGHGGKSPGAVQGNIYEKKETLKYSKLIKKYLESLGYKVKLTRDNDVLPGDDDFNPYTTRRVATAYETKSKFFFSIHLNSSVIIPKIGGVEIYVANDTNIVLAKEFAKNIVKLANTTFSDVNRFKIDKGVYRRLFNKTDVDSVHKRTDDLGIDFYSNVSTKTPYYFMLRETGGFMTYAYLHGREGKNKYNDYYNSNVAPESYLFELGYMNIEKNLRKLVYEKDGYVKAIVKTVDDYIHQIKK